MSKKPEEVQSKVQSDAQEITVEELASSLDDALSTPDGYNANDTEINIIAC